MWHVWGRKIHTGIWWGDMMEIHSPLGRRMRRWEDNIKLDLQEMGWGGMDWFALAQERDRRRTLVNAVMNLRVPQIRGIS
jgi:hypothetical protein